ncbi:MAG TPA: energy transducer TonB [Thermoanaerobaculia bacterium]|nr:energy transducer TonB [Thermoanaerobaculia bacterium]
MSRPFHYLDESPEPEGTALGIGVSLTLHVAALLFAFFGMTRAAAPEESPLQFVELIAPAASPSEVFTEAPGPRVDQSVSSQAALSDANRRASAPMATGDRPTSRPGDGSDRGYIPGRQPVAVPGSPSAAQQTRPAASESTRASEESQTIPSDGLQYRVDRRDDASQVAGAAIDWNSAIREAGRAITPGSGGVTGGEKGFAESGPISFESQWYDWGPYAAAMIARIRLHWYNNMPDIIRMGVQGVVVIRYTIQRNGDVTDLTILQSSGIPPFDFAARKAIELASPLAPLPADFPQPYERVTAAFYYNKTPPAR